LKQIF